MRGNAGLVGWPLRLTDPVMVDGYRVLSRLGSGGMADVFYARAPTGRPVAVKLLRTAVGALQICRREFELLRAAGSNCTSPAIGYGSSVVGVYLVTAYLPGFLPATTLAGRSMPAGQLWALAASLAHVLASVHARGIVHCDVKPANLLVCDHHLRLIDFGIARRIGEPGRHDGLVQCSRGWAAPEQLHAAPAAPEMDVFAWGCVIAFLATGIHPFGSRSEQEWLLRIQSAQPDLYGLPPGMSEVVGWALARDPSDRPTASELAMICWNRQPDLRKLPQRQPGGGVSRRGVQAAPLWTMIRLTERDVVGVPSAGTPQLAARHRQAA
jgi:serine/threonine protein kinase